MSSQKNFIFTRVHRCLTQRPLSRDQSCSNGNPSTAYLPSPRARGTFQRCEFGTLQNARHGTRILIAPIKSWPLSFETIPGRGKVLIGGLRGEHWWGQLDSSSSRLDYSDGDLAMHFSSVNSTWPTVRRLTTEICSRVWRVCCRGFKAIYRDSKIFEWLL